MKQLVFKKLLLIILLVLSSVDTFAQVTWTKHPENPLMSGNGNGTWDKHVFAPDVIFNADSNRYEMWYCGSYGPEVSWYPYRIGFAYSSDGIRWTKYEGNPVLVPDAGSWDEGSVSLGSVLRENGQYKLWYYGSNNNIHQIGYATSPDGITWSKNANPVLSAGSAAWEAGGVLWCSVLSNSGEYTMYYTGKEITAGICRIGRATSVDGINWQRDTINNPILTIGTTGQWDDKVVCAPYCLYTSSMIYMLYTGWANNYFGSQIGLATSTNNGITWTKHANNPVIDLGPQGSWDANYVEAGSIILVEDTLYTWYDGSRNNTATNLWRIGLAKSPIEPVSVENEITQPTEFLLSQNHPNPFNPSTKIKYSVPQTSQVQLKVFDVLGNEIETLVNEEKPSGTYELTWNAADLPSGVYFYQLKAGEYTGTKKMILLK